VDALQGWNFRRLPDGLQIFPGGRWRPARAGKMTQKEGELRHSENIYNQLEYRIKF
jgi:hypothetical protein